MDLNLVEQDQQLVESISQLIISKLTADQKTAILKIIDNFVFINQLQKIEQQQFNALLYSIDPQLTK